MRSAFLLEDDPERGEHIRALFHQHGYDVVWATSLREAQQMWVSGTFDIAALDHDLGPTYFRGNGYMFVCWVVQQPDVCQTRFIVHSANIIEAPKMVAALVDAGCRVARVWPDAVGIYLKMLDDPSPRAGGRL